MKDWRSKAIKTYNPETQEKIISASVYVNLMREVVFEP